MFIEPGSDPAAEAAQQRAVDQIVREGPRGALALAGLAAAIVVLIWILFYALVFVPRS
jgi:hypothetical protein